MNTIVWGVQQNKKYEKLIRNFRIISLVKTKVIYLVDRNFHVKSWRRYKKTERDKTHLLLYQKENRQNIIRNYITYILEKGEEDLSEDVLPENAEDVTV